MPKKKKTHPRERGTGSKETLPSGRVRWRIRDKQNNTLTSGTADNEDAANYAIAQAMTALNTGTLSNTKLTVREYADVWLERRKHLEHSTIEQYARHLQLACDHLPENLELRTTKAHHIRDMLTKVADRTGTVGLGLKRQTSSVVLAKILTRVRTLFSEAQADGLIPTNPTLGVKRAKVARVEHPGIALDFEQASRFQEIGECLHAAMRSSLWPALFTCVSIGLRRGEVLALTWRHVDLEQGVLSVRQVLVRTAKGWRIRAYPKTDSSARDIPIPDSLHATLTAHRASQNELSARVGGKPSDLVFESLEGHTVHPDNLNRSLEAIVKWSDPSLDSRRYRAISRAYRDTLQGIVNSGPALPAISPHDLRHTAGSLMLMRGMPLEAVARILGHADSSVTSKTYIHITAKFKKENMVDLFTAKKPVRTVRVEAVN